MQYRIEATNGCEYDVNTQFELVIGDLIHIRNPFYLSSINLVAPAPKTIEVVVSKIISKAD